MPRYLHASPCHALTRRSIDLRQLYRHAAVVCEPGLRLVLDDNVRTLDLLVADLQAQARDGGERVCRHGSWHGAVHRHLAGWLVHSAERREQAWLRVLGHAESALLQRFEQAIADAPPESARVLRRQLPRLHGIHLDMHNLASSARY